MQGTMRSMIVAVAVSAGIAQSVHAGVIRYQVRNATAATGFSQNVQAVPGDLVEVRVRVAYNGDGPVYGLFGMNLQPLLTGSFGQAPGNDRLVTDSNRFIGPLFGGSFSTPRGTVDGNAGEYGRVGTFGATALRGPQSTAIRAFYGTGTAAGLARISQSRTFNWIGEGTGANNTSGAGGFRIDQLVDGIIPGSEFNEWNNGDDAEGEYVFQFGFVVGQGINRSINVTTGLVFGGNEFGETPMPGQIAWYRTPSLNDTFRIDASTIDGTINVVPAPGALVTLAGVAGVAIRRRRGA